MIDAEVEMGDGRLHNYPAPENSFALRLDDELALRLTESHNVEGLYRLVDRDREHLARWVPWTATATPERVHQLVTSELARFAAGGGWRAELCFRGEPVGLMWLHDWGGAGGSTEIGYFLFKDHEGKGLVTRALGALIKHFFEERSVGHVAIGLDVRNERSLRVVQRLGLKAEAVLRRVLVIDGEPADLAMYGLLREEYEEGREGSTAGTARRPPRFALAADAGDGLYLGLFDAEDAPELHALVERNRDRLVPWMPWARDVTSEAQKGFIVERALPAFAKGMGLEAGIWLDGRLVGSAGIHSVDSESRSAAVGYWLDAGHEGRGVVTRVVRSLLRRCFSEPLVDGEPFERLEIGADVENMRSRAVAERLGFRFEGVLRRYNLGGYTPDMAMYSLLRSEWEAMQRGDAQAGATTAVS